MPAKKKEVKATEEVAEKKTSTAPKKTVAKKTTVKKETAKKVEEPAKAEKPAKKTAAKTTAKKETAKKAPAKKAPAKKAAAKKTVAKAEEVAKKSFQEYKDVINWKKWEAHNMNWLYIEVNAGDLLTELEAGVNNLETAATAILDCMLEGDHFIVEPKEENKISADLTVRYYCDNLSDDRRKWSEVQ